MNSAIAQVWVRLFYSRFGQLIEPILTRSPSLADGYFNIPLRMMSVRESRSTKALQIDNKQNPGIATLQ